MKGEDIGGYRFFLSYNFRSREKKQKIDVRAVHAWLNLALPQPPNPAKAKGKKG